MARSFNIFVLVVVALMIGLGATESAWGQATPGPNVTIVPPFTITITDDGAKPATSTGLFCTASIQIVGGVPTVVATADFHLTLRLTDNSKNPPTPAYVSVAVQQISSGDQTPPVTVPRNIQFVLDSLLVNINNTINNTLLADGTPRYAAIDGESRAFIDTLTGAPGTLAKKDFFGKGNALTGFVVDNVLGTDSGGTRPPPAVGNGNPAEGTGASFVYLHKFFKN